MADLSKIFTVETLSKNIESIEDWNTEQTTDLSTIGKSIKDNAALVKDKST